jgi:hypothetical protein
LRGWSGLGHHGQGQGSSEGGGNEETGRS